MQPHHEITRTNFTVNGYAFSIAVYTARGEAKRFNKKIVCGWNVLIHEKRNDSVNGRHTVGSLGSQGSQGSQGSSGFSRFVWFTDAPLELRNAYRLRVLADEFPILGKEPTVGD